MTEVASRWAFVASLALHAGVLFIGLMPPKARMPTKWLSDFWAGNSFEVPDLPDEPGAGDSTIASTEMPNEIGIDGLDLSTDTQTPPPHLIAPPEPWPGAAPRALARSRPSARAGVAASPAALPGNLRAGVGAGSLGAEDSAPGVRDLLRSFVRTVPIVASSDAVWSSLPLGEAGSVDVTLALDDEGKPQVVGPLSAPSHIRRLIQKTVSVMSSGRFGIGSTDGIASEQRLHIAVNLTQQAAPSADQAVSGGLFALRYDPPDDRNVSHAFFTLATGRRVEVSVRPWPH
jgi:hypothetical protein